MTDTDHAAMIEARRKRNQAMMGDVVQREAIAARVEAMNEALKSTGYAIDVNLGDGEWSISLLEGTLQFMRVQQ